MGDLISKEERAVLAEAAEGNPGAERWVYSDNMRGIIDDMVSRGVMRPTGAFVFRDASPETIELMGTPLPVVGKMVSLYSLTPGGRDIWEATP